MAESSQYLIEHGHSWEEISSYPPHLYGRFIVACHRIDENRVNKEAYTAWASTHLTFDGLKNYLSKSDSKNTEEITPEQSRKAAIGLMNALSGKR